MKGTGISYHTSNITGIIPVTFVRHPFNQGIRIAYDKFVATQELNK